MDDKKYFEITFSNCSFFYKLLSNVRFCILLLIGLVFLINVKQNTCFLHWMYVFVLYELVWPQSTWNDLKFHLWGFWNKVKTCILLFTNSATWNYLYLLVLQRKYYTWEKNKMPLRKTILSFFINLLNYYFMILYLSELRLLTLFLNTYNLCVYKEDTKRPI